MSYPGLSIGLFWTVSLMLFTLSGCLYPTPDISGEIQTRKTGDTLIVAYDLRVLDERTDSVTIGSPLPQSQEDSLLYRAGNSASQQGDGKQMLDGKYRFLKGQLVYPGAGNKDKNLLKVNRHFSFTNEKTGKVMDFVSPGYSHVRFGPVFGERISLGVGSYEKTGLLVDENSKKSGIVPEVDIQFLGMASRYTLQIGCSIHGESEKPFGFFSLGGGGRWYPLGRCGVHPVLSLTGVSTQLEVEQNGIKYKDRQGGVEAGAGLEGDFETLEYAYASSLGGIHTLSLLLTGTSNNTGLKLGTIYSLHYGENFRMLSIRAYAEGATKISPPSIRRYNHRPLWHKILASLASSPVEIVIYGLRYIGLLSSD